MDLAERKCRASCLNCLKLHDVHSHFLTQGEGRHPCEFGFQNHISGWGLKNHVESIPFSRFSEQESNVNPTSGHLKFMKIALNSI